MIWINGNYWVATQHLTRYGNGQFKGSVKGFPDFVEFGRFESLGDAIECQKQNPGSFVTALLQVGAELYFFHLHQPEALSESLAEHERQIAFIKAVMEAGS